MQSPFVNEGTKSLAERGEASSQLSSYLSDPNTYPSNLYKEEYFWSSFYPQNNDIQKKKKKKIREQNNSEKKIVPLIEPSKEKMVEWLKGLSVEERFNVFSIQNSWLAITFSKMFQRWRDHNDILFALLLEENKRFNENKSLTEFGDFETHFYCRKNISTEKMNSAKLEFNQAEKELIGKIRLYDSKDFFDTVVIDPAHLHNIDEIIKLFEIISDSQTMMKACRYIQEPKYKTFDYPLWFNSNSFQTFGAWLVSNFERNILEKYYEEKKDHRENPADQLNSTITLDYRNSLLLYWKDMESSKRKKLLGAYNDIIKTIMNTENLNPNIEENKKEFINSKLRSLYEKNKPKDPEKSLEYALDYFNSVEKELDDNKVIDDLIFTPITEFATIKTLALRKLAFKLKNMFSEKLASDLIQHEETTRKKVIKKKFSFKKPVQEAENQDEPDKINNGKDEKKSVLTINHQPHPESDQTSTQIKKKKKKNKKKSKDQDNKDDEESKSPAKDRIDETTLNSNELKNKDSTENDKIQEDDDMSIFDQLDNKMSKSQKKKS